MPGFHPFHPKYAAAGKLKLILLAYGFLLCGVAGVSAGGVKLVWNPNPETDIAGYIVHYGKTSGQLGVTLNVGKTTTATLDGLEAATTYRVAVQAYNLGGLKSPLSNEISFTTPAASPLLVKDGVGETIATGDRLDLGLVNLGAISDVRTFTVKNTGTATLNGLSLVLGGGSQDGFKISGDFPLCRMLEFNGSFESGLNSWTASGNVGVNSNNSATDGTKAAVFGSGNTASNGVLSRSFSTTPGVSYTLYYDVGVHSYNTNDQRLYTKVTGSVNLITATAILKGDGSGGTIWSPRSLTFVANSLTTSVTFADISSTTASIDLVLDNVRVKAWETVPGGNLIASLSPGSSASFSIAFQPGSAGIRDAILRLTADPGNTVLFGMNVSAAGNVLLEPWLADKGLADGPAGNADGDDLNNLQEFAFGTDPASAGGKVAAESGGKVISRGSPVPRIVTSPSFEFRGQFCRRKNHEAAGLIYRPQFSADLITWVDAAATPQFHADDGEIEIVSVAPPTSINGKVPRFFRVGVDQKRPESLSGWLAQNGAGGGTNGNPDGDALDNFFEFAFGTDPAVAQTKVAAEVNGLLASRGAPTMRLLGRPGAADFEFRGIFCRRKDRDSQGLIYKPQFSADLVTWVDATGPLIVRADDGEIEVVSVSAPKPLNGKPLRFFRVGLSQESPAPIGELLQIMETAIEDPDGNPDDDGLNNLLELAFGTDPGVPQSSRIEESNGWLVSRGEPTIRVATSPEFEFRGVFGRRKDRALHKLNYRPQFSADLTNWMDAAELPVVVTDDGEIEMVSVRAPVAVDGKPMRFFRVAVGRNP